MDQTRQKHTARVPGLDGLRAVAIVGIVLYHMFPGAVRGGYLGVSMFFVLSGYLLARTSLRDTERGAFRASDFYRRRLRRIYPALLCTLALTLLAMYLWLPGLLAGVRQELLSVVFGYQNWRQILLSQDYFTRISATTPFTHLWSLAVELQFYLIWPLLFGMYRMELREGTAEVTTALLFAFAAISAAAMAMAFYLTQNVTRVYYGTDMRAHALLLGCALGLLPERDLRVSRPVGGALFALSAGGLLALMLLLDGAAPAAYYGLLALAAVLSAVLVLLCTHEELPYGRWLDFKPLVWLGQRSYELYLTMYPVLFFFERLRPVQSAAARHLLEAAVIVLLSLALHALTQPGSWLAPAGQPRWRCVARPAFWAAAVCISLGTAVAVSAPAAAEDLDALALQLEENRRQLTQETAAPAPTAAPTEMLLTDALPTAAPREAIDPASITMVGDSVMLGALNALQETFPGCVVDALVSRQVWDCAAVFDALEAEGRLGPVVVLALGTNGSFSPEEGQQLIDRLGPDRQIYWVTAYGTYLAWQEETNESIRTLAARNENVTLVDWAAAAEGQSDWLYSDGIHLEGPGQRAYAALLADAMGVTPQS